MQPSVIQPQKGPEVLTYAMLRVNLKSTLLGGRSQSQGPRPLYDSGHNVRNRQIRGDRKQIDNC